MVASAVVHGVFLIAVLPGNLVASCTGNEKADSFAEDRCCGRRGRCLDARSNAPSPAVAWLCHGFVRVRGGLSDLGLRARNVLFDHRCAPARNERGAAPESADFGRPSHADHLHHGFSRRGGTRPCAKSRRTLLFVQAVGAAELDRLARSGPRRAPGRTYLSEVATADNTILALRPRA